MPVRLRCKGPSHATATFAATNSPKKQRRAPNGAHSASDTPQPADQRGPIRRPRRRAYTPAPTRSSRVPRSSKFTVSDTVNCPMVNPSSLVTPVASGFSRASTSWRAGRRCRQRPAPAGHPQLLCLQPTDPTGSPDLDPFMGSDQFTPGEPRTYRWTRELSANEWVAMLATFSDHQRLGKDRLLRLQDALRAAIDRSGGTVRSLCGTYVWSAHRL
jgi:hypothetical protein